MARDKVYLMIVQRGRMRPDFFDASETEMKLLAESAGGVVVGVSRARLESPSPSHFLRRGKLEEVATLSAQTGADVLIFNVDLSPVQARNIETAAGVRAVDRAGLILDIFSRRALSREGKLQVELAQLSYLLPRLVGRGVIMSRLGGGIGTRGPGEQKLEVDRRKIRERIQRIKENLEKVRRHRQLVRSGRKAKRFASAALVGYTNAGKSTLLNALTGADAYVEDRLFATLDPKTRAVKGMSQREILVTDTVGFITDLPHTLIEAFHATLEETADADVLIHVLDAAHPDCVSQKRVVEDVLREIDASTKPVLLALNKADLLEDFQKMKIQSSFPEGILISAKHNQGLQSLLLKLSEYFQEP